MLLRPRKTIFKNFQKKRTNKTIKTKINVNCNKLIYGQFGLKNQNPNLLLFNKHLFKLKIFLKKTVRKSNITNRYLWFKIFPHFPITKKVIGSRMGKGKGKPSNWAAKIPSKLIFIEFRNVRAGRVKYFMLQVSYKLSGSFLIVSKYPHYIPLNTSKSVKTQYDHHF